MRTQFAILLCALIAMNFAIAHDYGFYGKFRGNRENARGLTTGTSACNRDSSGSHEGSNGDGSSGDGSSGSGDDSGDDGSNGSGDDGSSGSGDDGSSGSGDDGSSGDGSQEQSSTVVFQSTSPAGVIRCPCTLMDILFKLCGHLHGAHYDIVVQFLIQIQETVFGCADYSEDMKFTLFMGHIQVFLAHHIEIKKLIWYLPLPDFGFVCDFFHVVDQVLCESEVDVFDNENGTCAVCDALSNHTNAEQQQMLDAIFVKIQLAFSKGYSKFDVQVLFYTEFCDFFSVYPDLKEVFASLEIHGYGLFAQFFATCEKTFQTWSLEVELESVKTAVLGAINVIAQNESHPAQAQFAQFHNDIAAIFNGNSDAAACMAAFMNESHSFCQANSWDEETLFALIVSYTCNGISVEISIDELIYLLARKDIYNIDCEMPDLKPTTVADTTTTEAATTTTPFVQNCSSAYLSEIFVNRAKYGGKCAFVYSLELAYNTSFTMTCRNQARNPITRCNNFATTYQSNPQQAANSIYNYLGMNPISYPECRIAFVSVTIVGTSGRVCDMSVCTPSSSNQYVQCPAA